MNSPALNNPALNNPGLTSPVLDLKDIHLPEPVSWWPIAPGWWIIIASLLLITIIIFISRKIYLNRQLKRDINTELENIKLRFQITNNKLELAQSLSILLRRASISYYPDKNIAGLTGKDWLLHLDSNRDNSSNDKFFQSETGEILLNAPYLPASNDINFNATALIELCEIWLKSSHKKFARVTTP